MNQVDLFTPEIDNARLDGLILQAARNTGYQVREIGSPLSGWTSNTRKTPAIMLGMEACEVSALRSLFKNFIAIAGTEVNV